MSRKKKKRLSGKPKRFLKMKLLRPLVRRSRSRINVDPTPLAVETHGAIDQRKNRVVATEPDILAWQKLRSTLADDDVAGDHDLTAEFFHAEAFADAIASILD